MFVLDHVLDYVGFGLQVDDTCQSLLCLGKQFHLFAQFQNQLTMSAVVELRADVVLDQDIYLVVGVHRQSK